MIQTVGMIFVIVLFAGSACAASQKADDTPQFTLQVAKISEEKAAEIALKEVPGNVTEVVIEKKRGKKVYVVEIIEKGSGAEVDVFVDIETGEVVGTDR
jgi:uncharacterized membrane protein YkoI